ncbi:uncharacterized protein F4822DRAFT_95497 [Hypoxylon trugodes]|uniref:uncharacterized protein n=1 Tax=Hypoxylon trugodes TaxID=326681 RepID=UPI002191A89D|nr:uncharacterized protein F4822DRAFT_95497 [Hypoxylon trugodes]KAI1382742.1 hypothetical protein F4822DRAFT_95497 [Hypoxylon trugodes]
MASNQPTTTAAKQLSMMTKISPHVYFYEPETAATQESSDRKTPKLILIASWMDARDLHIAKYITRYQVIYPTSKILLVRFFFKHLASPSEAEKTVVPALEYIRSQIDSGALSASPARPEILVHVFSNGGLASTRTLYELFRSQTGRNFPIHTAVYDSCPGLHSFRTSYNVFMVNFRKGILRLVAIPFVVAFVTWIWVWYRPLKFIAGEDILSKNSRLHNDLALIRQTNRSYVYGKADAMVDWRHVEKHAEQAAAKGLAVRKELFEHSPHVSHMRTDGERYWNIVTETWEKSMAKA